MKNMKYIIGLFDASHREKFILRFAIILAMSLFLMNFVSFPGFLQGKMIVADSYSIVSVIFLIVFSLLGALCLMLYEYRAGMILKSQKGERMAMIGGVLGLLTSACSVCYPFLLAVIGIPAAFAILPFGGLEAQALSIVLLCFSIAFMAKDIESPHKC